MEAVFESSHAKYESHLKPNEYFEIFVSELILRNRSLSRNQLLKGRLGGGGDGGVDSFYIFVDDDVVTESNRLEIINRNSIRLIELFLIQAKHSKSWDSNAIHKLNPFARDLLDPGRALPNNNQTYSCPVLRACNTFREIYDSHSAHSPTVNLRFYYASKGRDISAEFRHLRKDFCRFVGGLANGYKCHFEVLGAAALVDLSRIPFPRDYCLQTDGAPLQTWDEKSYIVLANLKKFAQFISDCERKLNTTLFEANVRDWEGKNKVNAQIRESLDSALVEEFWWLNNGITILAASAKYDGTFLRMNNPEIVNGLQTSRSIHEYFSEKCECDTENRRLLVRVIVLPDGDGNDGRREVIRATNSHTAVKDAEIRSLDAIHFDIQKILNSLDPPVYYERRKKYYRNLRPKVKVSQIISVSRLAQSVIAVLLCRPDDAKGRPGDYLQPNSHKKYASVFNPEYPLEVYYYCAMLFLKVDKFMKTDERHSRPSRNVRLSLRYHVMTHLAMMYGDPNRDNLKKRAEILAEQDVSEIQDFQISDSVSIVLNLYRETRRLQGKFPWKPFESELLKRTDRFISQRTVIASNPVTPNEQNMP